MIVDKVDPTKESIKQLVKDYPKDTPVTMLNILRFKEKTGDGSETGLDAYKRYGANAQAHMLKAGAKVIWAGKVLHTVIGDPLNQAHQILLVEYDSVDHFLGMVLTDEYQAITPDRTLALEYGGLLACQTLTK